MIDYSKVYVLGTRNFLFNGNDGYDCLKSCDKYDETIEEVEIFDILYDFFIILQNFNLVKAIINGNNESLNSIRYGFCDNFDELKKFIIENVLIEDDIVKLKLNFIKRIIKY